LFRHTPHVTGVPAGMLTGSWMLARQVGHAASLKPGDAMAASCRQACCGCCVAVGSPAVCGCQLMSVDRCGVLC